MELDLDKLPSSIKHLRVGDLIGHLRIIRRSSKRPTSKQHWRVNCEACGEYLTVPAHYLVRRPNPKVHCGCLNKTNKTIFNQEYRIWIMMRKRCTDEKHVAFKHYGGRGIKVCDAWFAWETGFELFLADMGARPSKGHSLDRIEVDGNYEPGNVRWATAKEQAANTRAAKKIREALSTKTISGDA